MKRVVAVLVFLVGLALFVALSVSVYYSVQADNATQVLLLNGKTAAARESRKATAQIRVILCDSLLIDRTELKSAQQRHIVKIAEAMIQTNCQGVSLPAPAK